MPVSSDTVTVNIILQGGSEAGQATQQITTQLEGLAERARIVAAQIEASLVTALRSFGEVATTLFALASTNILNYAGAVTTAANATGLLSGATKELGASLGTVASGAISAAAALDLYAGAAGRAAASGFMGAAVPPPVVPAISSIPAVGAIIPDVSNLNEELAATKATLTSMPPAIDNVARSFFQLQPPLITDRRSLQEIAAASGGLSTRMIDTGSIVDDVSRQLAGLGAVSGNIGPKVGQLSLPLLHFTDALSASKAGMKETSQLAFRFGESIEANIGPLRTGAQQLNLFSNAGRSVGQLILPFNKVGTSALGMASSLKSTGQSVQGLIGSLGSLWANMRIGATSTLSSALAQLKAQFSGTATSATRLGSNVRGHAHPAFDRFVATMAKALISMAGVLVAFNLFVTLPQLIARSILSLVAAVVKFGEEISKTTLQTAGLIASFVDFGESSEKSFGFAAAQARRLQFTFAELAASSLATAQDMQKGFQVFVARGGLAFSPGDMDKAARTAAFLVNLTIALTGELQKERQIYTEIDAVMQGQARAGAVVARLLKAQVGDLKSYLELHRRQGDLLEDLQKRFGGINEASKGLGRTLTGMLTSITGSVKVINALVYQQGAFKLLGGILGGWRDLLQKVVKELGNVTSKTQSLSPETTAVLNAFAYINLAVKEVVLSVQALIRALVGTKSTAEGLEAIFKELYRLAVLFGATFNAIAADKTAGENLRVISDSVDKLMKDLEKLDLKKLAPDDLAQTSEAVRSHVHSLGEMFRLAHSQNMLNIADTAKLSKQYQGILDITSDERFGADPDAIRNAANAAKNFRDALQEAIPGDPINKYLKAYSVGMENAEEGLKQMSAATRAALAGDANALGRLWKGILGDNDELSKLEERALKAIIKMQQELDTLRADEDIILKIIIAQNAKVEELKLEYRDVPEQLKIMLDLQRQITAEMIKQAEKRVIRELSDEVDAALASLNKYSAAQNEIEKGIRKIKEQYASANPEVLKLAVELERSAISTRLIVDAVKDLDDAKLARIRENEGEFAELEEKRYRAAVAINALTNMEWRDREALLETVLALFDIEREILAKRKQSEISDDLRSRVIAMERLRGVYSEIDEVEEEHIAQIKKINILYKEFGVLGLFALKLEEERYRVAKQRAYAATDIRLAKERIESARMSLELLDAAYASSTEAAAGIITLGEAFGRVKQALSRVRSELKENQDEIDVLRVKKQMAAAEDQLAYDREIRNLEKVNAELLKSLSSFDRFSAKQAMLRDYIDDLKYALQDWLDGLITLGEALKRTFTGLLYEQLANLGPILADMFTSLFEGEDMIKWIKKFLGKILIALGSAMIEMGVAELVASMNPAPWWNMGANAGHAIAMMAAGAAAIAAGAALGASGGSGSKSSPAQAEQEKEPKPHWVRNQDVAAQQGIHYVLQENTRAIDRLNVEVSRLSKESGDVLVSNSISKNPNMLVRPLMRRAANSFEVQRSLGAALTGGGG